MKIWIFQNVTEAESKKLWMCVFKCQDRSGKDPNVQPLESAAEKRRLLTMGKTATRIFTVTTAVSAIAPKILHNAEGASGRHVASACEWGPGRQGCQIGAFHTRSHDAPLLCKLITRLGLFLNVQVLNTTEVESTLTLACFKCSF